MERDLPLTPAQLSDTSIGAADMDFPVTSDGPLVTRHPMTTGRAAAAAAGHVLADEQQLLAVVAVERDCDHVTSFWLASANGTTLPAPVAGQYLPITVSVPGHGVLRRTYTISAYQDGRYRLSIKSERTPGRPPGKVSNYVNGHWAVGSLVSAGSPRGHFVLDSSSSRLIVLLAGGIGITPLLAMLRDLAVREERRKVIFMIGMRHRRGYPLRSEVSDLMRRMPNLVVHVRYSEQFGDVSEGPAPESYGRVDEALLRDLVPAPDVDVYLCGPAPFMKAMDRALAALGVPDERVRFEAFGPATIDRRRNAGAAEPSGTAPIVGFVRSGIRAPFHPRALSLLEFAEDLGLSPPFNCRSGNCGACATRKLSGSVLYADAPAAVVARDEVLICCALPDGPISLDL